MDTSNKRCFICRRTGHMSYQCSKEEKEYEVFLCEESDDEDNLIHCIKCNSTNHTIDNCSLLRKKQRKK